MFDATIAVSFVVNLQGIVEDANVLVVTIMTTVVSHVAGMVQCTVIVVLIAADVDEETEKMKMSLVTNAAKEDPLYRRLLRIKEEMVLRDVPLEINVATPEINHRCNAAMTKDDDTTDATRIDVMMTEVMIGDRMIEGIEIKTIATMIETTAPETTVIKSDEAMIVEKETVRKNAIIKPTDATILIDVMTDATTDVLTTGRIIVTVVHTTTKIVTLRIKTELIEGETEMQTQTTIGIMGMMMSVPRDQTVVAVHATVGTVTIAVTVLTAMTVLIALISEMTVADSPRAATMKVSHRAIPNHLHILNTTYICLLRNFLVFSSFKS